MTPRPRRKLRIDVHVHLAGVGTEDSGCWTSARFRRRPTFLALRLAYGIGPRQIRTTVDGDWARMIAERVADSDLDRAVALGFDGVYDERGVLDRARSQMIVPLDWVFTVSERHPELLPGPSVNPHRGDALERLEECIERGAVLIKWLPTVQAIDPASPRIRPFLRRVADAGIPLLIHAGTGERTFRTVAREFMDVRLLAPVLEAGVKVICAHSAARIHASLERDQLPELHGLLRRHPDLWVDNSGIANPARFAHLPRLARDPLIAERTLHGSDYPVPSDAFYYLPRLGPRGVWRIERERNKLQRDVEIKRALGFGEASFTRAAGVLANLERWCQL
jgi:predicted TIM-barrel fold metal-dependent hydrolase